MMSGHSKSIDNFAGAFYRVVQDLSRENNTVPVMTTPSVPRTSLLTETEEIAWALLNTVRESVTNLQTGWYDGCTTTMDSTTPDRGSLLRPTICFL